MRFPRFELDNNRLNIFLVFLSLYSLQILYTLSAFSQQEGKSKTLEHFKPFATQFFFTFNVVNTKTRLLAVLFVVIKFYQKATYKFSFCNIASESISCSIFFVFLSLTSQEAILRIGNFSLLLLMLFLS